MASIVVKTRTNCYIDPAFNVDLRPLTNKLGTPVGLRPTGVQFIRNEAHSSDGCDLAPAKRLQRE
jgi:hypothetical protein